MIDQLSITLGELCKCSPRCTGEHRPHLLCDQTNSFIYLDKMMYFHRIFFAVNLYSIYLPPFQACPPPAPITKSHSATEPRNPFVISPSADCSSHWDGRGRGGCSSCGIMDPRWMTSWTVCGQWRTGHGVEWFVVFTLKQS